MDRPQHIHLKSQKIHIRPSRIAGYYCAAVALLSWLSIGLAALPWHLKILLSVAVAVYGGLALRSLLIAKISVLEFRNGCWFLRKDDCLLDAELGKKIFLGAGMMSLPFTLQSGENIRLLLWPDSADADSLRRLRAVLLAQ